MKLLLSFSQWSVYGMLGDYKKNRRGRRSLVLLRLRLYLASGPKYSAVVKISLY